MNDPERTGDYQPGGNDEPVADAAAAGQPEHVGRYRIEKVLGQGGFGLVYLAHDDQLQRLVAIKVPHRKLVDCPEAAEAYLTEARTVANLDHPHIVPVFDIGSTEDYPCYVVSKYIDGSDLAKRLKRSRLSIREAVELVATVAEALHHAHKQMLVHRDIKPGNILLDKTGKPFVADFGLALREQDAGKGPRYAGTPAYMSPEQARGEGHRVDGRSDIFSLGVVFNELLVGRPPFRADSQAELMEQVTSFEARPPRQYDDGIPKELERICLKALLKRASERYSTAKDMADDLRHFLAEQTASHPPPTASAIDTPASTPVSQPPSTSIAPSRSSTPATTPTSDHQPIKIVPKGLRSFDEHDADFFLELLPGPRDRDALPDSIRFWKTRIEEKDADSTFSVGLIYGPSGCGKSSLVKAGLLPRLSDDVIAVYVEATAVETETRLLNALRKRCALLPDNWTLKATLAALRRGQGIPAGKKVVIVLDQFEQWLHAKKEEENTELVQALRQCDGGRVQCIVMVRDDFWMAATRFMRDLEVRLLEGENSAAVDLFPIRHAEKVLAAFGRAFGVLPENPSETSKEQKRFLEQAVSGLAQEGKVICVRLALFAEMMKGKAWTPASLKAVGGTEGVGVTFLEETFSAATAPPEHRYHQKAARADLKILLPETGSDIKGHMRSYAELLEASGYGSRPKDFDDLIRILDNEIRLITPTDPQGKESDSDSVLQTRPGQKYYQLTHDYLVHSIREWLTRKQKETRRGRAELLLADRAGIWNARPENRQLPSLLQWIQIRWFTAKKNWTVPQQTMMRKATRYHVLRGLLITTFLVLAGAGLLEAGFCINASVLSEAIRSADTAQLPQFLWAVEQMERRPPFPSRMLLLSKLRRIYDESEPRSRERLHASLALLPVDSTQADYLSDRLLDAQPHEFLIIRDALARHGDILRDKLWHVVETPEKGKESQRLRAAAALAKYDPESEKWAKCGPLVVNNLVLENPIYLGQWSEAFQPVKKSLLAPLADIFRDQNPERASERNLATNLLADYAADQPQLLADLLLDADEKQFAIIYPKFNDRAEQGLPWLTAVIDTKLPADLPSSDDKREALAKRQANAAVALLRMDQPAKVWPLLKHSPDPRVRSYLIHRLGPLGADAGALVKRLDEEPDITIRRALLLALGEFGPELFPVAEREARTPELLRMYREEPDAGLHGAAEWLLRRWKQDEKLQEIDKALAKRGVQPPEGDRRWYVNGQGQTFVLIPGPVEFVMGSPPTELDREEGAEGRVEMPHRRRIARNFALAAKEVTVEQFLRFRAEYNNNKNYSPTPRHPVNSVTWYEAAEYCNWLSKAEGIAEDQWCYLPNSQGKFAEGMRMKPDWLSLTGYRLPTEAEWEFACRAGATTSRFYGETDELLVAYAWYTKNSQNRGMLPPGSLKPNELGLFDLYGNAGEWCQDQHFDYPRGQHGEAVEDIGHSEDIKSILDRFQRIFRGASFGYQPKDVRSAQRSWVAPSYHDVGNGLRPARTYQ